MPRDSGGLYTLPAGNPVVPLTVIESDWANPTMSDVGQSLTDSLSRSGKGGMLASLRGLDGSAAVPAWSWTNEPSTGRYRAGPGQVVESVLGQPVVRYLASGLEQWDSGTMAWVPLTPRDALGTPFDPAPSNLTATNVQDAIEEVNNKTGGAITADSVSYDDTAVYFPAATVQIAIDRIGADIPGLANDILDNSDAILIVQGDLILLTNRVTQVEITAGNNANNIALNTQQINANTADINTERGRVDSIELEQIQQNSDILQNTAYIDFVDSRVDANVADITTNFQNIAINAAEISQNTQLISNNASNISANTADIATNTSDIVGVYNITQTNAANISANTSNISQNASDIAQNAQDLQNFNAIFPGGVLQVANGGTGVTSSTGTGSTVRSSGATIDGSLVSNSWATTVTTADDSTRIATTAWVKNQGYSTGGGSGANCIISAGSNVNGGWSGVRDETGGSWQLHQWGQRILTSGKVVTMGTAYTSQNGYQVVVCALISGVNGNDSAGAVSHQAFNQFTASNNGWNSSWITMGLLTYTAAFAAIPLSGDRYYHKVLKTEWIEQFHGPWTSDPDVVVLPPGNTFWGDILASDEELTYDIDNLPLARVPRVVTPEETINGLLSGAGLTKAALRQAQLSASRGDAAPLTAFNATLDALILAEPYTEAQFIEVL